MPSSADFDSLRNAIRSNSLDEIKKMLQRDDAKELLEMADTCGNTPLLDALYKDVKLNLETLELLLSEIKRIGGPDLLKEQLEQTSKGGYNLLGLVLIYGSFKVKQLALRTITDAGGPELFKKQVGILVEEHYVYARDCISIALVCSPKSALDYIKSTNLLTDRSHGLYSAFHLDKFLAIDSLSSQTLFTICAMLFERGIFKDQFSRLNNDRKTQLVSQGIDANWTPEKHIDNLLQSGDPRQALHQVNLLCKYISNPPLGFLNDKVLHSPELLNSFAAPSFFNCLNKLKLEGNLPRELEDVYVELSLLTFPKVKQISVDEAAARREIQHDVFSGLQDLAICVHENALKSSFNDFRASYFDFFKTKHNIEEEAARRTLQQKALDEIHATHREAFVALAVCSCQTEMITLLDEFAKERLQLEMLCDTCGKRDINLTENAIQLLVAESTIQSCELEFLDEERFAEMNLAAEDRKSVFLFMRRVSAEHRQLLCNLFTLQREQTSLVAQVDDRQARCRFGSSIADFNPHSTAIKKLEELTEQVKNENLELTQLISRSSSGEERSNSQLTEARLEEYNNNSRSESANNTASGDVTLAHPGGEPAKLDDDNLKSVPAAENPNPSVPPLRLHLSSGQQREQERSTTQSGRHIQYDVDLATPASTNGTSAPSEEVESH